MSMLWALPSILSLVVVSCVVNTNAQYDTTQYITSITFHTIQDESYAGEQISFTGTLYSEDEPLPDKSIQICRHNMYAPDECFTSGTTDSQGQFVIPWIVESDTSDFDIYAVFDGDAGYRSDKSGTHNLRILKYGGYLVLDTIPHEAYEGDIITFSGMLNLDGRDTKGAIIYIKERDTASEDDILGNAYVNDTGHFSTNWPAINTDSDESIEVYAVFEGNDMYHKISTCDMGPTVSTHQSCQDVKILQSPTQVTVSPITSERYIEVYKPLEFESTPKVAIISDTKDHYTEIMESITSLTTKLKERYGGSWDVEFGIITDNALFHQVEPDIIIHVVTPKTCEYHTNEDITSRPVQVTVCIDDTSVGIKDAVLHQFKHAIGMGHAFNMPSDINYTSNITLAGIVLMYGTDGFLAPNNQTPDAVFTAKDYQDELHLLEISDSSYSSDLGEIRVVPSAYGPGDSIQIRGWYWDEYRDTAKIVIIDPNNMITDVFDVDILDSHTDVAGQDSGTLYDGFEKSIAGYYTSGTYKVRMYDNDGKLSANSAFEVTGPDVTPPDSGVVFTNDLVYMPKNGIHITVLYSHEYEGASNITITDSSGYIVESLYIHTDDGRIRTYTHGYDNTGTYNIQVYDKDGGFIADTIFYVVDVPSVSYTGKIYTAHTQYMSGDTVLIDGHYNDTYDESSTIMITNQDGQIVEILNVDVTDSLFSAQVQAGNDGTYDISLYDYTGGFVTDVQFHVIPAQATHIGILNASTPECDREIGCFRPQIVRISEGETVSWTNHDTVLHSVTGGSLSEGPDGNFDSGLIKPGSMFIHTFDEKGTYPYFCMVHPWKSSLVIVQ